MSWYQSGARTKTRGIGLWPAGAQGYYGDVTCKWCGKTVMKTMPLQKDTCGNETCKNKQRNLAKRKQYQRDKPDARSGTRA